MANSSSDAYPARLTQCACEMRPGADETEYKQIDRGMLYMSFVAALSKIAALASQWILGFMLLPVDFALYAAVLSAQTVIAGIREAGVGKYLVQKGNFANSAYPTAIFALWSNLAAALVLWLAAPWFVHGFGQPDLLMLLVPVTLLLPLQSLSTVFQAKARIEMRFKSIALIETIAAVVQNAIIAALALLGAGVYSLICGAALGVLTQLVGYRKIVGSSFERRPWTITSLLEIFHVCKWIMLTGVALSLGLRGDYLILGFCPNKQLVGNYFFGVQLVMATVTLFSSSIQSVVLPAFCRVALDSTALSRTFENAQRRLTRFAVPTFALAAATAPLSMHVLWAGKWDHSAVVVQLFLLVFVFRLQASISMVLLEARGWWKERMLIGFLEGLFVMMGAAVGLIWESLPLIAAVGAAAKLLASLFQMAAAAKTAGISAKASLLDCVRGWGLYTSAIGVVWLLRMAVMPMGMGEWGGIVMECGMYASAVGVCYLFLNGLPGRGAHAVSSSSAGVGLRS